MSYYAEPSIRAAVGEMVAVHGLRAWCRQHELSPSMVSDYLRSESKPCPPSVAAAIGFAPIRLYSALPVLSDADRSTPVEHDTGEFVVAERAKAVAGVISVLTAEITRRMRRNSDPAEWGALHSLKEWLEKDAAALPTAGVGRGFYEGHATGYTKGVAAERARVVAKLTEMIASESSFDRRQPLHDLQDWLRGDTAAASGQEEA